MLASISFRPLERCDFPLIQEWLAAPHVAVWWNEQYDLASVEAKYGPRVRRRRSAEPDFQFDAARKVLPSQRKFTV